MPSKKIRIYNAILLCFCKEPEQARGHNMAPGPTGHLRTDRPFCPADCKIAKRLRLHAGCVCIPALPPLPRIPLRVLAPLVNRLCSPRGQFRIGLQVGHQARLDALIAPMGVAAIDRVPLPILGRQPSPRDAICRRWR